MFFGDSWKLYSFKLQLPYFCLFAIRVGAILNALIFRLFLILRSLVYCVNTGFDFLKRFLVCKVTELIIYFVFAQCEFIDCVGRRSEVNAPRAFSEDFNKLFM